MLTEREREREKCQLDGNEAAETNTKLPIDMYTPNEDCKLILYNFHKMICLVSGLLCHNFFKKKYFKSFFILFNQ